MLFSQNTFFVFFALVLVGHFATRPWRAANNVFLLLASWLFFLYWSLTDFLIFFGAMSVNYVFIAGLGRATSDRGRRTLLLSSLVISLGTLAAFKYRQFFGANLAELLNLWGWSWRPLSNSITIPLAVSFYTFHMISLVCDVHARKYPAPGFVDYCLYLSFFPQILAGPIVRGDQMLPQLARHPRERATDLTGGLYAFVLGLFFKAVIADHISDAIDPYWTHETVRSLSTLDAWCVAALYSAQIFADFGGYSFMAIGLGKILGFELPTNFDAPYLAASFQEFWHRWHVTLSSFLRDYLFIGALGGSRVAAWRIPVNVIVTMLLGGLWHGPAWNFIAWGGLHGCALAIERSTGFTMKDRRSALARGLWFGVVSLTVLVAWVMFRAPDLRFAIRFLGRMAGLGADNAGMHLAPVVANALPLVLPVVIYHLARTRLPVTALWQSWAFRGIATGSLTYVVLMAMHSPRGFIYFVF